MHLLSIKNSTLSLKQSFIRHTHRFSTQSASTKKRTRSSHHPHPHPSILCSDIVVIETTSIIPPVTATATSITASKPSPSLLRSFILDKKKKRKAKTLTIFNIIVEDEDKHTSLVRFITDVTELSQLLHENYGSCDLPQLPILLDNTATLASSTSTLHLLSLRQILSKFKSKKRSNAEKLEAYLNECIRHPIVGRTSLLRDFLSPQRDGDSIITKEAIHNLVQQQALHDQSNPPTTFHVPSPLLERPPSTTTTTTTATPMPKVINSLSIIDESACSAITDKELRQHTLSVSSVCCSIGSDEISSSMAVTRLACHMVNGDKDENEKECDDDDNNLLKLIPLFPSPPSPPSQPSQPSQLPPTPMSTIPCLPIMASKQLDYPKAALNVKPLQKIEKEKQRCVRMTLDDLQFLKVLGKGCMGKVLLVRHHQSCRLYALKAISKEWVITQREIEHAVMERNILSKVSKAHHPFLIKLHHSFQNANQLFLVMDYHVGSDLATQLQLHYQFNDYRCRFYIVEILLGLQELHRLGILYRDLKPENILLAADGHIVLTDFGFSRLFDEQEKEQEHDATKTLDSHLPFHTHTFCGTPEYMAPEIFLSEEYSFAVDYWSLGIVMYEMLLGYTPFGTDNDAELYRRVLEDPVDIPQDMSPATADVILGLLERSPEDRLGCAQFYDHTTKEDIRQHPYFSGLNWSDVYHKRLPAPYIPRLKSETDVSHFDPDFIKLSPRLSTTHHPDALDSDDDIYGTDDDDDDPFGLGTDSNIKKWKSRYNNNHYAYDNRDEMPLDQAFIGYSFINESTCVDNDSLLDEDDYQQQRPHALNKNDSNSAPLAMMATQDGSLLQKNDRKNCYYSGCPTMTSLITNPVTTTAASSATHHYHHDNVNSSTSSLSVLHLDINEKNESGGNFGLSSQQIGFSRFQQRRNQQQTRLSSSFTLSSLQSESDDVIWIH